MKLAVISTALPPSPSGQAVILYRLLKDIEPGEYCLISSHARRIISNDTSCTEYLRGKYYFLPHRFYLIQRIGLILYEKNFGLLLRICVKIRIHKIEAILKKEQCTGVIVCSADLLDPYCALIVCKKLGIPLIFYAFDDYINQWIGTKYLNFSKNFGPEIIKSSNTVIVPNEFLKKLYDDRFGINSVVIHNPVNLNIYGSNQEFSLKKQKMISIVYTGAIYDAHYDSFINLIRAMAELNNKNLYLHIYTSFKPMPLINAAKNQNIVFHNHIPLSQITNIQKEADILFLALAFESKFNTDIIKTASPAKMGEYLAAGKTILVHAPPDSFVSWYFTFYQCGMVADKNDYKDLAQKINKLINDPEMQARFGEQAMIRAKIDFNEVTIRNFFYDLLVKTFNKV